MAGLDFQVLPDDMLEFLDAPVPYIVSLWTWILRYTIRIIIIYVA